MKFSDLPADIISVRVRARDGSQSELVEQAVLSISADLHHPDEFEVRLSESVVFVRPVAESDVRRLGYELADGRAILAQLANPAKDGSIDLQVAFFSGSSVKSVGNRWLGQVSKLMQ